MTKALRALASFRPPRRDCGRRARRAPACAALTLAAALTLLAFAASPAAAFRGHVFERSFGGAGSGPGQFSEPAGIAVSEATSGPAAGDVYVVDDGNDRVERFGPAGAYQGEFNGSGELLGEGIAAGSGGEPAEEPTGHFSTPLAIVVDNDPTSPSFGDVYVIDRGFSTRNVIDKFGPTGQYLGQITAKTIKPAGFFNGFTSVAVDKRGEVWVTAVGAGSENAAYSFTNALHNAFLEPVVQLGGFGFTNRGLAVDSRDDLFVNMSGRLMEFAPSGGKPLREAFAGETVFVTENGIAAEPASDDVYADNGATVRRFDPSGGEAEAFGAGRLGSVCTNGGCGEGGLALSTATGRVYVGDAATDEVQVYEPEPPAKPKIASRSAADVSATSATLEAEINPRSEPAEEPTSYRFEYGACLSLAACPTSPYERSAPVPDGLIASDYELHSVSTHPAGLAPHTPYHYRVVASNELGETEGEEGTFTTQPPPGAPTLPDARQWEMVSPSAKQGANLLGIGERSFVQASASGDAVVFPATSATEPQPRGNLTLMQVLSMRGAAGWGSRDLEVPHQTAAGVIGVMEEPVFSSDLSRSILRPFGPFDPSLSAEASEQTPYLRTHFLSGNVEDPCVQSCLRPLLSGAPGFEDVVPGTVFSTEANGECERIYCGAEFRAATPDLGHVVLESVTGQLLEGAGKLYEWSGGRLAPLDVLPEGEGSTVVDTGPPDVFVHALSDDGSVFFTHAGHLYLRDFASQETARLDVAQGVTEPLSGDASLLYASSDGHTVLFKDSKQLTSAPGGGFYACRIVQEGGQANCGDLELTGLPSAGMTLIGASQDASYLYLVGEGDRLYLDRFDGMEWTQTLVATLSGEDSPDWSGNLVSHTARVSPNGRWLAFMSQRSLTGYDNTDAHSPPGEPHHDEEVFLYHAGTGGGEGSLTCASCDPTGARPVGLPYGQIGGLVAGPGVWPKTTWIAANIPGFSPFGANEVAYQSRYLSDSGRLFFDSAGALVPQDANGAQDVYEFEPSGVGGCESAAATFSERSGGCTALISSGSSPQESAFVDASESGNDVFFLTQAKLSPRDADTSLDVYDARVGGGEVEEVKPVECSGDACQPPVVPPSDATPGSLTFHGAGNLKESPPVRKKHHKKKRKANKHKRAHKRANGNRGGNR